MGLTRPADSCSPWVSPSHDGLVKCGGTLVILTPSKRIKKKGQPRPRLNVTIQCQLAISPIVEPLSYAILPRENHPNHRLFGRNSWAVYIFPWFPGLFMNYLCILTGSVWGLLLLLTLILTWELSCQRPRSISFPFPWYTLTSEPFTGGLFPGSPSQGDRSVSRNPFTLHLPNSESSRIPISSSLGELAPLRRSASLLL